MSRNLDAVISRVCRVHCWIKSAEGKMISIKEPLDDFKVAAHLAGHKQYGACPVSPGTSTCRIALFDLDSHKGETSWEDIKDVAREIKRTAGLLGIRLTAFKSSGGRGIHLFAVWSEPQDAYSVRCAFTNVLTQCGYKVGTDGVVKQEIEIFPKQNEIAADKFGSMFVLPYAGKSELLTAADEAWALSDNVKFIPNPRRKTNGSDNGINASSVPVLDVSGESQTGADGGCAGLSGGSSGQSNGGGSAVGSADPGASGGTERSVAGIREQSELQAPSVRESGAPGGELEGGTAGDVDEGAGTAERSVLQQAGVPVSEAAGDDLVGNRAAEESHGDGSDREEQRVLQQREGERAGGLQHGVGRDDTQAAGVTDPNAARNLRLITSALAAIPDGHPAIEERDPWRDFIFAIHQGTRGSDAGLAIAQAFSARSKLGKYQSDAVESLWAGADTGRSEVITEQTIFRAVRLYGWWDDQLEDFDVLVPVDVERSEGSPALPSDHSEASGPVSSNKFPVWTLDEFSLRPAPSWRIKDFLPAFGLGFIFGQSGSGKSFVSLDVACAIVRGIEWRGLVTRQCRVVYLAAEGARGFRWRIDAYKRHHGLTNADLADLFIMDRPPNMMLMDDVIEMTKSIRTRSPIGVIFIDTLAQVTPGANENAGEDMGTLLLHCRMIADVTGALVVLIHHSGKDDSKGARGWSGFRGNADVMHEVTRTGEVRTITVYKMKDGVENTAYGFRLEPVFLDMDEDMELTSSCVVMPVEGAVAHAPSTKKGPNEQRAMADRIIESIGEMQGVRQDTGPVPYDALVTHVEAKMVKPPDDKKDRRGERIRAGIQRLMDSHELEGVNGHVAKVSN